MSNPYMSTQTAILFFQVTMRLVRRLRGSTMVEVAPPRGQTSELAEARVLPLACINDAPYCKLFSANKQQVRNKKLFW